MIYSRCAGIFLLVVIVCCGLLQLLLLLQVVVVLVEVTAAAATKLSSCEEPINYIKYIKVVGHDLRFSCFCHICYYRSMNSSCFMSDLWTYVQLPPLCISHVLLRWWISYQNRHK